MENYDFMKDALDDVEDLELLDRKSQTKIAPKRGSSILSIEEQHEEHEKPKRGKKRQKPEAIIVASSD